jgi:hypothetical protein
MTSIEITISKINQKLISAFALLDSVLDRDELFQKAEDNSTMLHQIEHILFTNQILLHEIEAGVRKAHKLHAQGEHRPGRYSFVVDNLKTVLAKAGAREVMNVQDDLQSSPETLRLLLRDQLYRCLYFLDQLSFGQVSKHCVTARWCAGDGSISGIVSSSTAYSKTCEQYIKPVFPYGCLLNILTCPYGEIISGRIPGKTATWQAVL